MTSDEPTPTLSGLAAENEQLRAELAEARKAIASIRNGAGEAPTSAEEAERKRAEEALRETELRFRMAKAAAKIGIFDHDLVAGTIIWDERIRELWGVGPDVPITFELFLAGLHPDDRGPAKEEITHAYDPAEGGDFYLEYRVVNFLDHQTRWIAAIGRVSYDQRRPLRIVGAVQDISKRKDFETELERLVAERTAKLQDAVHDLEAFSYSIAHDLRAPLRSMRGYAQIITDEYAGQLNATAIDYLGRIQTSAARFDLLIQDVLDYSRMARQDLPFETVDPSKLVWEIINIYPDLHAAGVKIEVAEPLPCLWANTAALTQVFSNLLGNAVKFVRPGVAPSVHVWAEIPNQSNKIPPRCVRLWIKDNGIGIDKNDLPRLFSMFQRLNRQEHYEGTGMGLAVVRKAVERMSGRIGAESEPGVGSRFWVDLMAADAKTTHDP